MNYLQKEYLLPKIKYGIKTVLSLIVVIAFFSWFDQVFEYTLISFKRIASISFLCTVILAGILLTKGWGEFFVKEIQLTLIAVACSMFISSFILLSINYLTAFGELKEEVYGIQGIKERTMSNEKSYHDYVKIWYQQKDMWVISPIDYISEEEYHAIALYTKKGIFGWEVIKESQLIP